MKNVILGHFNVNLRLGLDPRLDVQSKKKTTSKHKVKMEVRHKSARLIQLFRGEGERG